MVRAEIFGGLRLMADGVELDLLGAQRRRLASLLLAHSPERVSVSRLSECLDPDAQSSNPANAVQAQVRRLRRIVEPGVAGRDATYIRSVRGGYAFVPDTMDLWEFRELAAQAAQIRPDNPARAVELQAESLGMFATPWGELGESPYMIEVVASIRHEAMSLRDVWMESLLEAGLASKHVDEMVAAVRREPTRESRCVHAMQGLYRSGRQAEALRLHEEVRIVLRDQLGVSPGYAMREMHGRILAHDTTLHLRHTAVVGDPTLDTTSFVGRQNELSTMSELLGRHRVVTICGLSGVGKSRLAREWLERDCALDRAIWVRVPTVVDCLETADLTAALCEALGLGELAEAAESVDRWGSVRASLPHEASLVVIDGAELSLDEAARLALDLCDARPALRVLVTSQLPLGVSGEQVLQLDPLAMHGPAGEIQGTAVELAKDRLGPGASLTTAIELSERCGGLPLAVEMAAGTPAESAGGPEDDVGAGTGGVSEPGEVLSRVVGYATEHLSPRARDLLGLACVLPGGISMDAAEWFCSRSRPSSVHDPHEHRRVILEMVRPSLLKSVPGSTGVRFVAPEQIARLTAAAMPPEARELARSANASYLLTSLKERSSQQALRSNSPSRELLTEEAPNVAAARSYLLDNDRDGLADLLIALATHRRRSNAKHRIKQWVDDLLAVRPTGDVADVRLTICSLMLEPDLSAVARRRPEIDLVRPLLEPKGLDDTGWAMAVEVLLTVASGWAGELDAARVHMAEAKRIAGGDSWADAAVDRYRSLLMFAEGGVDEAIALAEDCADRLAAEDEPGEALGALFFAITFARTARKEQLRRLLNRAAYLVAEWDTAYSPLIMAEKAQLARQDGDPEAAGLLGDAASVLDSAGLLRTGATTRRDLGLLHLTNGDFVAAELELLQSAEALLILDPMGSAMALGGLALCAAERADPAAVDLRLAAWALAGTSGTPLSNVEIDQLATMIGAPEPHGSREPLGDSKVVRIAREQLDRYPSSGAGAVWFETSDTVLEV